MSLNGSPTVSPVNDALCAKVLFLPACSISFFALYQAHLALDMNIANIIPVLSVPPNKPLMLQAQE